MRIYRQSLESRCRSARSRGLQGKHPLQIPAHRHQAPLAPSVCQSSQLKLSESHHRFDDPEDRLGRLLAQGVTRVARRGLRAIPQLLHRRCRVRWWRGRCREALPPSLMLAFALERNQRLDARSAHPIFRAPRPAQPHFDSPQLRQVMQPSIITTAAVLHLEHSCAPSGKSDLAKASVWRARASYSARFSSTSFC